MSSLGFCCPAAFLHCELHLTIWYSTTQMLLPFLHQTGARLCQLHTTMLQKLVYVHKCLLGHKRKRQHYLGHNSRGRLTTMQHFQHTSPSRTILDSHCVVLSHWNAAFLARLKTWNLFQMKINPILPNPTHCDRIHYDRIQFMELEIKCNLTIFKDIYKIQWNCWPLNWPL